MTNLIVHPGRHGIGRRTTFGFMTDELPGLHRVQNAISAVCAVIAAVAIAASGILTLVEVALRAIFTAPLGWNIGFAERYLMVAIAFFGVVTAYRSSSHVAVATLFGRFPPRGRKLLILLSEITVFAVFTLLLVAGWRATGFAIAIDERIPPGMADLAWPSWTWRVMVPVAAAMGMVVSGIDVLRELTTPWTGPATDYDPGEGS
ncbi:membrane protein [Corynebacterium sphenisci DSM 44792]|uniref:Membrane protein n=1 Tax=Corynebacterium sphenisci DSM 44792 TaxID=1437874 RepID=A0A1L7CYN3_9CORY|nr:TRAP transporter small permease [Corynebacterium sphenisci]APT90937.1 membrane protein [Corynebacterium sphenisci DSM 44792]